MADTEPTQAANKKRPRRPKQSEELNAAIEQAAQRIGAGDSEARREQIREVLRQCFAGFDRAVKGDGTPARYPDVVVNSAELRDTRTKGIFERIRTELGEVRARDSKHAPWDEARMRGAMSGVNLTRGQVDALDLLLSAVVDE